MSQVNNYRCLEDCQSILVQITAVLSEELTSTRLMKDHIPFLRMIDKHIEKGSLTHKELGLHLVDNLVLNSDEDTHKIVKDCGIFMRIYECICGKDQKVVDGALLVLHNTCTVISKFDEPEKTRIFDEILSLKCQKL